MQLAFDAADRLVELVEERRGPLPAEEAARTLFALRHAPVGLARSLLEDVVAGDARLAWRGTSVALAAPAGHDLPLEAARFVVVDLETTGLRPGHSAICEIGAVRVDALLPAGTFQTFVDPGVPLPRVVAGLTGLADRDLRGGPPAWLAVRRLLDFAGAGAVLVAHNARFDLGFLDREVELLTGRRLAAPVVDTVGLARRLLGDRVPRAGLASLAQFFGTSVRPCHRALPDAQATAEILVALVGLAQERGAATVADLVELSAPRRRRVYEKRSLVFGAPARPGVYVFRDANGQALYVGRACDLRARLRSYFRSERLRPAVEAALAAVERVEWQVLGSELEAALEELRLIRELRPPANARGKGGRAFYLRRRGEAFVVSQTPGPLGPVRSRRRAERAARALADATEAEVGTLLAGGPLPRLRSRLRDLSECLRYEDAARLRDRIEALEAVVAELAALERLRALEACLLAPAVEPGYARAVFVAGGRVAAVRTVPPGAGAALEVRAGLAAARTVAPSDSAEDAEELLLLGSFLRRPPPELAVLPLEERAIVAALADPRVAVA
ncbi:MAG TPA: exonuclease domain-containing protein [Gaiellaceae bacterium]|nr:exonuclease domain-containing protein [Gaiellaceae bacterium]